MSVKERLVRYLLIGTSERHSKIILSPELSKHWACYSEVGNGYFINSVATAICKIQKRRYRIRYRIKIVASYRYRYSLPLFLLYFRKILVLFYWRTIYFQKPNLEMFFWKKLLKKKRDLKKNSQWTVMIYEKLFYSIYIYKWNTDCTNGQSAFGFVSGLLRRIIRLSINTSFALCVQYSRLQENGQATKDQNCFSQSLVRV